jgi:PAS domain S-box-containing protein
LNSDGALLEMACRRIADLDQPAYVKNSDLRYVAVNEAYARFFRRDISDFIGNRSRDLFDSGEEVDREDKERRALVFGSEETALCFDPTGSDRSRVQIESFSPSQDRFYVFGMFLDSPVVPSHSSLAPGDHDIPGKGVDEIGLYRTILEDLPVAAFVRDAGHRLIYSNEAYAAITGLSRAEALGKTEHEMFENGADDFFAENERVLNEGHGLEFEGEVVDRLHDHDARQPRRHLGRQALRRRVHDRYFRFEAARDTVDRGAGAGAGIASGSGEYPALNADRRDDP